MAWFGPGGDCNCCQPCVCVGVGGTTLIPPNDIAARVVVSGLPSEISFRDRRAVAGSPDFYHYYNNVISGLDAFNGTYVVPVEFDYKFCIFKNEFTSAVKEQSVVTTFEDQEVYKFTRDPISNEPTGECVYWEDLDWPFGMPEEPVAEPFFSAPMKLTVEVFNDTPPIPQVRVLVDYFNEGRLRFDDGRWETATPSELFTDGGFFLNWNCGDPESEVLPQTFELDIIFLSNPIDVCEQPPPSNEFTNVEKIGTITLEMIGI